MRPWRASLLAGAAAPVLLLTACTSPHAPDSNRPASPQIAETQPEKKLTAQAESALNTTSTNDTSTAASGVERVSDGVHTQPGLTPGATYKLTVVCAGSGAAVIEFTPPDAGPKKPVPCDQSLVFTRLTAEKELRLDVRGERGATGMIAWRIDKT